MEYGLLYLAIRLQERIKDLGQLIIYSQLHSQQKFSKYACIEKKISSFVSTVDNSLLNSLVWPGTLFIINGNYAFIQHCSRSCGGTDSGFCSLMDLRSNLSGSLFILEFLSTLSDRWDLCQQTSIAIYVPK
jgi:hypothetical protein